MTIYVARHGQTVWNAKNWVCGITDSELTEKGIKQAEQLAELVKGCNIDLILTSPLKRAMDTSKIIGDRWNIQIEVEPALIEQNYGIYEGVDRSDPGFLANKRQFAYKYPGGESQMQVAGRIYPLLERIKAKYADKNVLLVCHGGVCRVIKTYFEDMTTDEFCGYSPSNCQIEKYSL